MKKQGKLMKQRNLPWLGSFTNILFTTMPLLSIINFLSIITVLYATSNPYLKEYAPWMSFWMFIAFLVVLTLTLMLLVHKYILPSMWTYRAKQMFEYESQLVDKLDEVLKRLDELEKAKEVRK